MAKRRRSVTIDSIVTDIRIDHGRLIVNAVEQSAKGVRVASHDLDAGADELPSEVVSAMRTIEKHAAAWAEEQ